MNSDLMLDNEFVLAISKQMTEELNKIADKIILAKCEELRKELERQRTGIVSKLIDCIEIKSSYDNAEMAYNVNILYRPIIKKFERFKDE